EYVPGTSAQPDELLGIAEAVARAGHGIFQMAAEHWRRPDSEWQWMRDVAGKTGVRFSINLNQPADEPELWRETLSLMEAAQRDGMNIEAQVAGRSIGLIMCLQGTVNPLMMHSAYNEVAALPFAVWSSPMLRRHLEDAMTGSGDGFSDTEQFIGLGAGAGNVLTHEALRAGALGFSTSRTALHKSKNGEYVPGTSAQPDELLGIADAVARAGHGIFQMAAEHWRRPDSEWQWMRDVAGKTGVRFSINLNQPADEPELWRETLSLMEAAQREGMNIEAQVAGRSIGLIMCLQGTVNPLMMHSAYNEVAALPFGARVAALREAERYARLLVERPAHRFYEQFVGDNFHIMFPITGGNINYEPTFEESIAGIAQRTGASPHAIMIDQLLSNYGQGMIYRPFLNYAYGDLSMTHELLQHPLTRNGLSDAGAHCGVICDGGMGMM
ncbi:MAG: hypothetical protein ACKOJH_02640, partial [Actinomycetota bacterium]